MAKPEQRSAPQEGEASTAERQPMSRVEDIEVIRRGHELIEQGKNLGLALEMVGELETFLQFAEKHPLESVTKRIVNQFKKFENAIECVERNSAGKERFDKWVNTEFVPWLDGVSKKIERLRRREAK